MLSNTSVVEKSSVNTKRRFRSRGVSVMGLLGWLRRRKRGSRGRSLVKKRVVSDPRIKLHGEVIRMAGKSKKKRARKKKKEE
jgi:hypothetical protein